MRLTFLMGVVAFSSPRAARAGFAMDDSSIRTAVTAWFDDRSGAEATYGHISTWNTRGVTDMSDLFCRYNWFGSCSYYNGAAGSFNEDIGAWDTSGVTNMRSMFYAASDFNQDISGWSVDTVKDMSHMFRGASAFNQDIGDWAVVSLTSMDYMFYDASAFNQDLGWCVDDDVRGLDDMSSGAFYRTPCRSTKWTSCGVVQGGCDTPLTGSVMVSWKLRSAVIAWLSDAAAAEATYGHISTWETGGVTDMSYLFCNKHGSDAAYGCSKPRVQSFNEDISAWDTSGVTTMKAMFWGASAFNEDISNWAVHSVTDMGAMLNGAVAFNQDIGGWAVDNVVAMAGMFYDASAFDQDLGWCVNDSIDPAYMFGSRSTTPFACMGAAYGHYSCPTAALCESTLCGVQYAAALSCDGFMSDTSIRRAVAAWFDDRSSAEATYGHISTWDTSRVRDMGVLFYESNTFSDDISAWDTSGVTTMFAMFYYASSFNRAIGRWSVDKVTNMNKMFRGAKAFDQDLGWCLSDDVTLASPFKQTKCESTSCGVSYMDGLGLCEPWSRPCLIYANKQCIINSPTLVIFIIILVLFAGFGAYVHRTKEEDETYFAAARRLVISFSHSVCDRLTALAYALRNKMEPSSVNSRPDSPADSPRDESDEEATASESLESRAQATAKTEESVEPSSFSKLTSFLFGEREEGPTEEAPKEEEETATLPVFAEAEEEAPTEQPPPPPARRWFSRAEPEPADPEPTEPEPAKPEPKAEEMHQRMADWYNNAPEAAALRAAWGEYPETPDALQAWPGFVAVTNAFLDASPSNP